MEKIKYILFGTLVSYFTILSILMSFSYFKINHKINADNSEYNELFEHYNEKVSTINKENLTENGLKCFDSIETFSQQSKKLQFDELSISTITSDYQINFLDMYNNCFSSEKGQENITDYDRDAIAPYFTVAMLFKDPLYQNFYKGYELKFFDKSLDDTNDFLSNLYYSNSKRAEIGLCILVLDYLEYKEVTNE